MQETDSIVGLAHELGLERKLLYCWRESFAAGGADNLAYGTQVRRTCHLGRVDLPVCLPVRVPLSEAIIPADERIVLPVRVYVQPAERLPLAVRVAL